MNRAKKSSSIARGPLGVLVVLTLAGRTTVADPCDPGAECETPPPPGQIAHVEVTEPVSAPGVSPPRQPRLASGLAMSLEVYGGASISSYSVAPLLAETIAIGSHLAGSARTAWGVELVETYNSVLDHTTPEFGLVGLAIRHLAKSATPWLGEPDKTIEFQRVAAGLALAYDGHDLVPGIGAEITGAYLISGPHGVSVHLGGYFFSSSNVSRDALITVSLGYVLSPVRDRPVRRVTDPPHDSARICRQLSAYRYAVAETRGEVDASCADERAPDCVRVRARIRNLNEHLNQCMLGEDVAPPELFDSPTRSPAPAPGSDETHACEQLSAYRYALEEARGKADDACADANGSACVQVRKRIEQLSDGVNDCLSGSEMDAPKVWHAP